MPERLITLAILASLCGGLGAAGAATDDGAKAQRQAWFREAKFGLFVHWGLYCVPATNSKGPYVSWKMHDEGVPVADYEKYADAFHPTHYDPKKWVDLAYATGMRYVTFTTKHHEGFCMFDSALTDYDAVDKAPGRDLVRPLVEAVHAKGMKMCFYYSMLDWHQPLFTTDLPKYVDQYLFGQVRELCTDYGSIDGIWFDGEWDHPASTWRAEELAAMIHKLQPGAVVNDRLGKGERGKAPWCDFYTREQMDEIGKATEFEGVHEVPWEACLTIGTSWGYNKDDHDFKSGEELIRALVDVVSRGGNFLLNVGPTPEGEIPPHLVSRLERIGVWMAKNGESIYGTYRSPFASLPAGKCTTKGSRLYVHLESRPGPKLELSGLENTITRAWLLSSGESLAFDNTAKTVALPETLPDPVVTTIGIELDGPPRVRK